MNILKNDEQGAFLFIIIVIMAILLSGILAFFFIKNHEVSMASEKEYNLAAQNAAEFLFRKYTFLAKKGSPRDWKVGILSECYNYEKCTGSGSTAADCTKQQWKLRGSGGKGGDISLPYSAFYITSDAPTKWQKLPVTLNYEDGFITTTALGTKCIGLRLENIPVEHLCGPTDKSGESIKNIYAQVIMIAEKKQGSDSMMIIKPQILTSPNPIIYGET